MAPNNNDDGGPTDVKLSADAADKGGGKLFGSRGATPELPALPLDRAEQAARQHNDRLLIVGAGILVKGKIERCDTLVVEGRVEATLQADEIHVAAGGAFEGELEVNSAIIAGRLDGNVRVLGRLEITETGEVTGRVRYSQVVIREGGKISGDVQFQSIDDAMLREAERVRA